MPLDFIATAYFGNGSERLAIQPYIIPKSFRVGLLLEKRRAHARGVGAGAGARVSIHPS